MKYFIKTFGCQQNHADSERISAYLTNQGMKKSATLKSADYVVINTCMIRESAENRVYGLVNNLTEYKKKQPKSKIVITGCMAGMAIKDKTGKFMKLLKKRLPNADEFLAIEEIGFDIKPVRTDNQTAYIPISNGCNNFCSYCVVPYARGREISRPYETIISECQRLKDQGYKKIMLLGQNVNSYGSDLIKNQETRKVTNNDIKLSINNKNTIHQLKPIYVKHLGKSRIPTLFPYLLDQVAKMGFDTVDFMSSNPWDFSDELINVIAKNSNITRTIHLPVQSGDNAILKKMNRWYTSQEYLSLVKKLKSKIKNLKLTTDIIVGFCGETDDQFNNTVKLCKKVKFHWAYLACYSPRPMAISTKLYPDDVPHTVKDKRWKILDEIINQPTLKKFIQ